MSVILTGGPFIASALFGQTERYVSAIHGKHWGFNADKKQAIPLNAEHADRFRNDMRALGRVCSLEIV